MTAVRSASGSPASSDRNTLAVLHLASFTGNVGDAANHCGTRRLFEQNLSPRFRYSELEIREFYWRMRRFDQDFVDRANAHDLLLIGGGNFFELWVESSASGTSIDLSVDLLAGITVPTVFYGLGVDIHQGYSDTTVRRFRKFLDHVLGSDRFFVALRNDGASANLRQVLGDAYADAIAVVPDGGFFAWLPGESGDRGARRQVGLNLAGDMIERRYGSLERMDGFLAELGMVVDGMLAAEPDTDLILVPHIFADLAIVGRLHRHMRDEHLRRRVTVATLAPHAGGLDHTLGLYRSCDWVIANRFHANACPIGMAVPTIGLANYPQILNLYRECGLDDRVIESGSNGFAAELSALVASTRAGLDAVAARYAGAVAQLRHQADQVHRDLDTWLARNHV